MTDARSADSDAECEERALERLPDFSLERALEIRRYLIGVRGRNSEQVKETLFKQMDFYLENEELNHLIFVLSGGHSCGSSIFSRGNFKEYLQHTQSCEKCTEYLIKHDLTPEKVSETLEKIKSEASQYPSC